MECGNVWYCVQTKVLASLSYFGIERALNRRHSMFLMNLLDCLKAELEMVLEREDRSGFRRVTMIGSSLKTKINLIFFLKLLRSENGIV